MIGFDESEMIRLDEVAGRDARDIKLVGYFPDDGWPIWSRGHRDQETRSVVATRAEGVRHTPGRRTTLRSEPFMAVPV